MSRERGFNITGEDPSSIIRVPLDKSKISNLNIGSLIGEPMEVPSGLKLEEAMFLKY